MEAALREDDQFSAQRNSLVDVLPMTPQILGWVEAAAIGAGRDPGHGSAQRVSVAVAVESPALFQIMAADAADSAMSARSDMAAVVACGANAAGSRQWHPYRLTPLPR
jgi:hypothetical protein